MKNFLITLIVIVVIAVGVGPLMTANMAESHLEEQVNQVNEVPGYTADLLNYDKGWFNATAQLRVGMTDEYWNAITAGNPAAAQMDLSGFSLLLDLDIAHGPLLFGDNLSVGLVAINGTLNEDSMPMLTEFREQVGIDHIMSYQQVINLLGAGSYQVTSPAFEFSEKGFAFSFGGMDVSGNFDVKDRTVSMTGGFAEMRIVDPNSTVVIDPITMDSDMQVLNWAVQLGSFEMVMPGMKVYSGADVAALPVMEMNNLKITTNASYDSDDTIAGRVTYSFDGISGQGMNLQDFMLDISMEHISLKAAEQLMDMYQSSMQGLADPQAMQQQLAMSAMTLAPELLKHSPIFSISDLSVKFNGEPLNADARIEINTEGMDTVNINPQELMQKLVASLNLTVSEGLMQQFGPMLGGQQGMFEQTADGYSVKISMKDGAAALNGQPIPLPL